MIGGFDQFHFFNNCSEEETRKEVRRCFAEAGEGGGFILSPSDHFFDADLNLIRAFADEAPEMQLRQYLIPLSVDFFRLSFLPWIGYFGNL